MISYTATMNCFLKGVIPVMYKIIANIDDKFDSAEEALDFYDGRVVKPTIPSTRSSDEDSTTPRICVAESIENCISSIGYTCFVITQI